MAGPTFKLIVKRYDFAAKIYNDIDPLNGGKDKSSLRIKPTRIN